MRRAAGLLVAFVAFAALASACGARTPPAPTVEGRVVAAASTASHTESVGRAPRRIGVDQLRASIVAATGFSWTGPRRVSDPESPNGFRDVKDADLVEALAPTLGRADYESSTSDNLDPGISFSKLAGDAARSACKQSVHADAAERDPTKRRILRWVEPNDTASSNGAGVRKNLAYLALRFWGRTIAEGDAELAPLAALFDRASSTGTASDGWRAVCIALATDPQFLTY